MKLKQIDTSKIVELYEAGIINLIEARDLLFEDYEEEVSFTDDWGVGTDTWGTFHCSSADCKNINCSNDFHN